MPNLRPIVYQSSKCEPYVFIFVYIDYIKKKLNKQSLQIFL